MKLLKKEVDLDHLEILYDVPFTPESFARDFVVKGGEWMVREGWLYGVNQGNFPGMAISRQDFFGDVMLDFKARTVAPCTHDINVMWSGSWNEQTNTRDVAYVAGLAGWWDGKVGFEKSPEYKLNVATKYLDFEPGRIYHVQCGSCAGHVFVVIDGKLALEITDPDPIDTAVHGKVGFEAYCSRLAFTDFKVKRLTWTDRAQSYVFEG